MTKKLGNVFSFLPNVRAQQRKRLDAQLNDRQIDQQIHERYRAILEKQYYHKQKKEWVKVGNKIQNLLNK